MNEIGELLLKLIFIKWKSGKVYFIDVGIEIGLLFIVNDCRGNF